MIVKSKVNQSFVSLTNGNYQPALDLISQNCRYKFVGEHALGGTRSNRDLIELWFQRFLRILPNFQFACETVIVEGWPWNTRIAVKLAVSWTSPRGEVYENDALQMIWLKWFKAVKIITIDDSKAFGDLLQKVSREYGTVEASSAPIEG